MSSINVGPYMRSIQMTTEMSHPVGRPRSGHLFCHES